MRQAGQLTSEKDARRFVAWLTAQQIDASAEQDKTGWSIWIRDEDKLPTARAALAEFSADPTNARYADAEKKASSVLREREAQREQARRNQVQMRDKWGTASGMATRRSPLTLVMIGLCVVVSLMSDFGQNLRSTALRELQFSDHTENYELWRSGRLQLKGQAQDPDHASIAQTITWHDIRRGEFWRVFTPMFVHSGVAHLIFNMLMLYSFGGQIENRYGTLRMLLLVLVLAGLSNVAQATAVHPNFGGMSGVIYGLFGFVWMRSTYDPNSRLHLDRLTVIWLLIWFVLCIATEFPSLQTHLRVLFGGGVANVAHAVGLVVGMAIGIPWLKFLGARRTP